MLLVLLLGVMIGGGAFCVLSIPIAQFINMIPYKAKGWMDLKKTF